MTAGSLTQSRAWSLILPNSCYPFPSSPFVDVWAVLDCIAIRHRFPTLLPYDFSPRSLCEKAWNSVFMPRVPARRRMLSPASLSLQVCGSASVLNATILVLVLPPTQHAASVLHLFNNVIPQREFLPGPKTCLPALFPTRENTLACHGRRLSLFMTLVHPGRFWTSHWKNVFFLLLTSDNVGRSFSSTER